MSSAPRPSTPSRRDALFILAVAVLGAVVARVLRHVLLHDVAHVQDELAYVFQAQTLVTGHLTEPLLLPRAAFNMWFIEDRWSRFGIFPPGWPVLLAAGIRLHVVDWVNPALHALSVGMVARIARRIAGRRATLLATVLYAFSPQALFLAASLMSHTLVALCATVVLLYGIEQVKRSPPSVLRAIAAGLALGVVAGTRPLCMVCLSLFAAGCLVYASIAERRLPWADVVGLGLPLAVALALLFFYNASLTGSALVFPQNNYFNEHLPPADSVFFRYHHGCNNLGFGHGCDWSIVDANHTLETALDNTGSNLRSWLLLAGGGPLVFAAALFAAVQKAHRRMMVALVTLVVGTILAYTLYWHPGTCYGARFYHLALPALIVAAAVGLDALPRLRHRLFAPMFFSVVALWLGWNAFALVRGGRELASHYWGTDDRFARVVARWDHPRALVMVAFGPEDPRVTLQGWTFMVPVGAHWPADVRIGSAFGQNGARADGPVVFAKFHPGLVDELKAQFPDRELWLYTMNPAAADDTVVRYAQYQAPREHDLEYPVDNFPGFEPVEDRPEPRKRKETPKVSDRERESAGAPSDAGP